MAYDDVPDAVYDRAVNLMGFPDAEVREMWPDRDLREGDLALRDVLTFHGTAMNGGVTHAVESYAADPHFPLDRVLAGYRLLGMDEPAQVLEDTARARAAIGSGPSSAVEALELRADPEFDRFDDEALIAAVEAVVSRRPELFGDVDLDEGP